MSNEEKRSLWGFPVVEVPEGTLPKVEPPIIGLMIDFSKLPPPAIDPDRCFCPRPCQGLCFCLVCYMEYTGFRFTSME